MQEAAAYGHIDVAELLLANKTNVNAKGNRDETSLHMAVDFGFKDMVELLLAYKADVNAKDKANATPWSYAVFN